MLVVFFIVVIEIISCVSRRARLAHRHDCNRAVSAPRFVTFSSCRPWLPFWLPQQLAPPPDLATATGSRRRGARCATASRGARRSSSVTARRGRAWGGGRCSVPARTRRVWPRRSSPAPRRRASGLPAPARAASRPSRSSGPPRLPSRRRAGTQGLGGKPAAPSLAASVAVHGRLHHSARSGITLTLTLTLTLGPALVLTLTLTPTLTQALRCGGAGVARVRRLAAAWRSPLTVTHALDLVGALLATEGLLLYHDVVAHEQVY
jgi:hypothetical protein